MPPTNTRGVPRTYVNANRLWVDSRPRAVAQRRLEAPILRRIGGRVDGGTVLELGCGRRGTGLRAAVEVFRAAHADGVELHPPSVLACRRAVQDLGDRVQVSVGDATALRAEDGSYDAVFGYHVLHHAPDWRAVVREAARVLRRGGRFYSAEMTAQFVDSPLLRAVSFHPDDGDRPTPESLRSACTSAGLRVLGQRTWVRGAWTALVAVRD